MKVATWPMAQVRSLYVHRASICTGKSYTDM